MKRRVITVSVHIPTTEETSRLMASRGYEAGWPEWMRRRDRGIFARSRQKTLCRSCKKVGDMSCRPYRSVEKTKAPEKWDFAILYVCQSCGDILEK